MVHRTHAVYDHDSGVQAAITTRGANGSKDIEEIRIKPSAPEAVITGPVIVDLLADLGFDMTLPPAIGGRDEEEPPALERAVLEDLVSRIPEASEPPSLDLEEPDEEPEVVMTLPVKKAAKKAPAAKRSRPAAKTLARKVTSTTGATRGRKRERPPVADLQRVYANSRGDIGLMATHYRVPNTKISQWLRLERAAGNIPRPGE